MTSLRAAQSKASRRQEVLMAAHSYFAESCPFMAGGSSTISITGTVYYQAVGLLAGDVVTNLLMAISGAAGSGFSGIGAKVGIYSKAFALLASSGDVSGQLGATGTKQMALSAPLSIPADDMYIAAFLGIATTMPTFGRSSVTASNASSVNGVMYTGTQASQTDLPSTATIGSASNIGYWMGVS